MASAPPGAFIAGVELTPPRSPDSFVKVSVMRAFFVFCFWLVLPLPLLGHEPLSVKLQPLIDAHRGEVGVAVKHLETGEAFFQQADLPMPSASLIKVAVMVEVYHQAQAGKLKLTDLATLHNSDKVPGSGILTPHFSEGAQIPLVDAVRLMIAFSDNTATNLVLDKIGLEATSRNMTALGYPQTKLNSKVFLPATASDPERCQRFGLGSTTARETVQLFEQLYRGQLVNKEASAEMLQHLKKCDDKDKFPRLLPEGTVVAHKVGTGQKPTARTDGGILFTPGGPIALCVLTTKNEDTSLSPENAGNRLCATVAREVFNHFNPGANLAAE